MSARRVLLVVAVACLLAAASFFLGYTATGNTPALAQALDTSRTIPYSGQLKDASGVTVADGAYDFTFSLYEAPEGGSLLWSETQTGVAVTLGAFSTTLGSAKELPAQVFESQAAWLEIGVRGSGEAEFTLLSPRQYLSTETPMGVDALACPHNHYSDTWTGTSSYDALRLINNAAFDADGLHATSDNTDTNHGAVYARNEASTGAGDAINTYSGRGVGLRAGSGLTDGIDVTTSALFASNKSAVYAHSTNGNGVWGVSTNRYGVYGYSTNSSGIYGETTNDNSDVAAGVWGQKSSGGGMAIRGVKNGSSGVAVKGTNNGTTGSGVSGYSENYLGTWGETGLASHNYGFYTPDNLYSANYHLMGAVMQVVQNGGAEALEPGDVVVFVGISAPLVENGSPIIQVAKSSEANSTAVAGVVFSRYNSKVVTGELTDDGRGTEDGLEITPAGPAMPGEYLLVVVQGPAQVKASALADTIKPGDLLSTAGLAGYVTTATEVVIGESKMALPGTVLGKALDLLASGQEGLIYVYVTLH